MYLQLHNNQDKIEDKNKTAFRKQSRTEHSLFYFLKTSFERKTRKMPDRNAYIKLEKKYIVQTLCQNETEYTDQALINNKAGQLVLLALF